jgi:hypothetical protein
MKINYECPNCHQKINSEYPDIIHSGFNDSGFLYCDKTGDLLTWSSFDKKYIELIGQTQPWQLSTKQKAIIESSLKACDCGGRFLFSATPRCPNCNSPIPGILNDNIHWVRLKKHINGTKQNIWK